MLRLRGIVDELSYDEGGWISCGLKSFTCQNGWGESEYSNVRRRVETNALNVGDMGMIVYDLHV
jgi:hypothetical protein